MSIGVQQQIKNNATDIRNYVDDLYAWQTQINARQGPSPSPQPIIQKIQQQKPSPQTEQFQKLKRDSNTVKDYYDAWSKFDIDGQLDRIQQKHKVYNPFENSKGAVRAKPKAKMVVKDNRPKPVSDPTSLKDRGNVHFKACQFKEALQCYTNCLQMIQSKSKGQYKQLLAIVYSNRAQCELKFKEYSKAQQDCNKALFYNPNYVKALCRRGNTRRCMKNLKLGIQDYQKALMLEPNNNDIRLQLGQLKKEYNKKVKLAHESLISNQVIKQYKIEIQQESKQKEIEKITLDSLE